MALKKPSDFFGISKVSSLNEEIEKVSSEPQETLVEDKISASFSNIDSVFKDIQNQLQESSQSKINDIREEVVSLYGVVDNIIENEIPKYRKRLDTSELRVETRINNLKGELCEHLENQVKSTKQKIEELYADVLEEEVFSAKKFVKDLYHSEIQIAVEKYVSTYSDEIVSLREEVFKEIKKKPSSLEYIESKLNDLYGKYKSLSENLDNVAANDPSLTSPVTLEQLKNHYQLLVGRLQEQLASIGGGGEVRLQYLDDVVGVATNASAYDGKYLKYDHSIGKFVFDSVITGLTTETQTLNNVLGLGNISSRGMSVGVVTATTFSGPLSGDVNSSGISTFGSSNGIGTVTVGLGTFALHVDGNAQVTGILTVGSSSVTIDGINDEIRVGSGVTIYGNTGIISATSLNLSGTLSGNGSNLTGVVTSLVGYATEGYVDSSVAGVVTFSGNYNNLTNKPTIPADTGDLTNSVGFVTSGIVVGYATIGYVDSTVSGILTTGSLVGYATEGYVDNAVAGVVTFSGNYNNLSNKPTIPTDTGDLTNSVGFVTSGIVVGYATEGYVDNAVVGFVTSGIVVGYATEGYVDNAVAGVVTFSGNYNDLTNKPTIPADTGDLTNSVGFVTSGIVVGYATESYVDSAVAGVVTFTGAATTITTTQISNWDTSYGWGDHSVVGYATESVTNSLQAQINSLGTNLNIIGFYDASAGVVTSLTVVGETRGYISVGSTLPSVGITTGDYLIISTGGSEVGIASYISLGISTSYPGDWIVGVGNSEWNILSYSQQVVAPRATNADFADTLKANSSVNTSGIITASAFYGSGANLSGVITSLVGYSTEGYVDNAVAGVVTFSGNYNNLTNKPTIPTDTGDLTNSVGFVTSGIVVGYATEGYVDSAVAGVVTFSGNYNNLTNKPTIPSDTGDLTNSVGFVTSGALTGYLTTYTETSTLNDVLTRGNSSGIGISVGISTFTGDVKVGTGITLYSSTGIVSATSFYGNFFGSITNATNLTGGYANASELNVSGITTISQGRIQADASSNLRFGNLPAGSGSSRNIAIGDQVLNSLSGGSGRNIGIGELSYYDTTTGQYNIGIGIQAGQKITTGSYNVIIGGYNGQTGLDLRTSSNNVVIADGQGNIRQYIDSSGNVGIKTTVISEALTVVGVVSATSFYGTLNASQLTGILPAIDGSNLFGVTATGTGIEIKDDGAPVGTARTVDFGDNISVSFASGIATVSTSLVGYATEGYVDNSIVGFITSGALNGYATENYVSTASVAFASTAGIASALIGTVNINTTGIITASSFSGSASGLTNIPSGQLTGNLPAIDGSALLNVNATGEGIVVEDSGSNVGSARTVNFGTGLDVTYSASGIATVNASGGSLQSRAIVTGVTTSIADLGIGNTNITGFKSYALMKVGLSTAGWLRLYTDSASRENDASRSIGIDPTPGSGVIAEVVTTGISTTQIISPFVMGGNLDNPADTTIYASIKNLSGSTQSITANLTILQLEA